MNRIRRGVLFVLLLFTALAILRWWFVASQTGVVTLQPAAGCDLHRGPCSVRATDGGQVSLRITPQPIPVLEELQLQVRLQGIEAESVEVQFTGVDVDMGLLRYPLSRVAEGEFRGPAWLSVCSQKRMTWQALVRVESRRGQILVPFRFDTEYRRGFKMLE